MYKIKIIIILLFLCAILERLYLLPIYISLDTKPSGIRSAIYLAKSIAHHANADIELCCEEMEYENNASIVSISTEIDKSSFTINVFLNQKLRDEFLKYNQNHTKDVHYRPCFVKGQYYVVCEAIVTHNKKYIPPIQEEKYYHQFPGETLEYTKD